MLEPIIIYIALTEDDLTNAQSKVKPGDIIITDLACKESECLVIKPFISNGDAEELSDLYRNWFQQELNLHNFPDDLFGYVNNFYECSVRPVITYFKAIDNVLEKYDLENLIFLLPCTIHGKRKPSTYYMAEYESVGVYLYDRHSNLLPYIEDYLQLKSSQVRYSSSKSGLKQKVFNFFRVWGVLGVRFLKDCKNNWIRIHKNTKNINNPEYVFVVRTIGQSSTLLPFLKSSSLNLNVIIADSNTDSDAYDFLTKNTLGRDNISIIKRQNAEFGCLLKAYISSTLLLCRRKAFYFNYSGVVFNYNQAISEIIVMLANLTVYKCQVKDTLFKLNDKNLKLLFSLEQKSPHAYIDSVLANDISIGSAQIKQCSQHFWPIPVPVFSEKFLIDLPDILDEFKACWPQYSDKLAYIGSFQGAVKKKNESKIVIKENIKTYKICFFAGIHQKENFDTLNFLYEMDGREIEFNLTVKLHPRDKNIYSKMFPKAKIIHDQDRTFNEFCESFDIALTYPSSVISELLFNNLPFFIYRPDHKDYREMSGASDFKDIRTIYEKEELQYILRDIQGFKNEFNIVHEKFIEHSSIIIDVEKIDQNIINLTRLKGSVDN